MRLPFIISTSWMEMVRRLRRFALPGIPGRKSIWQVAGLLQDRINNFTLPASGKWIAGCGNQALALWNADGTLRWSQDWSRDDRHTLQLRAVNEQSFTRHTRYYRHPAGCRKWGGALASETIQQWKYQANGYHP